MPTILSRTILQLVGNLVEKWEQKTHASGRGYVDLDALPDLQKLAFDVCASQGKEPSGPLSIGPRGMLGKSLSDLVHFCCGFYRVGATLNQINTTYTRAHHLPHAKTATGYCAHAVWAQPGGAGDSGRV